jgi:hypothetical protein
LTSIPYSKVQSVSFVPDRSRFGKWASTSEIAVQVGGKADEVSFRGEEKAKHCHDLLLWKMG